jgi:prevent-host-death family protein
MADPTRVSLYEAKTHLSELGDRAANGEVIIVTKHGKPRFSIVPIPATASRPLPGSLAPALSDEQRASLEAFDWFAADEDVERDFGLRE